MRRVAAAAIPSVVFNQDEDTPTLKANTAISARSHHQSLALTTRCGSSEAFLYCLHRGTSRGARHRDTEGHRGTSRDTPYFSPKLGSSLHPFAPPHAHP